MESTAATTDAAPILSLGGLELRLARSLTTATTDYTIEGCLQGGGAGPFCDGGSLQIQNGHSGLVDEVFFQEDGRFAQQLAVQAENDTPLILALCDGLGTTVATVPITVRHRSATTAGDRGMVTVPRAVAIEVLNRSGQRRMLILVPAGVRLPSSACAVRPIGAAASSFRCGKRIAWFRTWWWTKSTPNCPLARRWKLSCT
jgi:hypothetical protein